MVIPQSSKLKPGVRFPCTAFLSVIKFLSCSRFCWVVTFGLSKTLLKRENIRVLVTALESLVFLLDHLDHVVVHSIVHDTYTILMLIKIVGGDPLVHWTKAQSKLAYIFIKNVKRVSMATPFPFL